MDHSAANAAILAYFASNFDIEAVKVAFPDDAFTPPNDEPWVRMNIQHYDGKQASIGAPGDNRHYNFGMLTFQVFTPENGAAIRNTEIVSQIKSLYFSKTVSGISYQDAKAVTVGNADGWFQQNVKIIFRFEEFG